jgi:hypothetical protein
MSARGGRGRIVWDATTRRPRAVNIRVEYVSETREYDDDVDGEDDAERGELRRGNSGRTETRGLLYISTRKGNGRGALESAV